MIGVGILPAAKNDVTRSIRDSFNRIYQDTDVNDQSIFLKEVIKMFLIDLTVEQIEVIALGISRVFISKNENEIHHLKIKENNRRIKELELKYR